MRVTTLASALALALGGADAQALGLGGIRVQSALNQPFVGEIDLLDVKPDELDAVKVQIAPSEEFSRVGAERYHYLTKLRFTPQISPRGNTVIRVSSREPIREPYMDFVLEVQWPKGRLVKEYTLLLDPPATSSRAAPAIQQPVARPREGPAEGPGATSSPTTSQPAQALAADGSAKPRSSATPAPAGAYPLQVGPVQKGEGLWRLALKNAPPGATVPQTAMALYRNNQGAFLKGDINRVIAGTTLAIPSSAELYALPPDAAQREYAAALRGEKVRRAPIADTRPDAPDESRLKIAGTPPEDRKPDAPKAPTAEGSRDMEQELLLVRESSESTRQETSELRNRIRELETQLGDIQKLLKLRNAELARIQGGGQVAPVLAEQSPEPVSGDPTALPEPASVVADQEASLAAADRPVAEDLGDPAQTQRRDPDAMDETPAVPPMSAGEPVAALGQDLSDQSGAAIPGSPGDAPPAGPTLADAQDQPVSSGDDGAQPLDAAAPKETAAPNETSSAQGPLAPEEPVLASLQLGQPEPLAGNPFWHEMLVPLAGLAGVTTLGLGALGWSRARRRRHDGPSPAYAGTRGALGAPVSDPRPDRGQGLKGVSETPGAVGNLAVASPSSVFVNQADQEAEESDVLSEVDIYIAYGRFREAEELLEEELRRTPDQTDLKFKLAEVYAAARKQTALQELMDQMQARGDDRVNPEHWQRLQQMAGPSRNAAGASVARTSTKVAPGPVNPFADDSLSLDITEDSTAGPELKGVSTDAQDLAIERPGAPRPPAGPASFDDEAPVRADAQGVAAPLDLEELSSALNLETEGSATREPTYSGGFSDLELTIDDLRSGADVDLDSFLDSTRTVTSLVDDTTQSRSEPSSGLSAARAAHGRTREAPPETGGLDLSGLLDDRDDIASSDLLTSQWQMDSGLWDETATKLDLARAYVEMGDPDSARGILEEVVAEGNEEQRHEGRELLQALG